MVSPKQESEAKANNITFAWAEVSVWTTRMLTALVNGVKGGVWFSLWDKVCKPKTLQRAWDKVRGNQGAAGIDKISIERFDANAAQYLAEIHTTLKAGTYHPLPVKRVHIPKGDGTKRPLGIPTVKDRIVQAALKMVLEPIFEKEFLPVSFGFRPGIGAKDALRVVNANIKAGYTWVVDADIKSYFDTIPSSRLMERIKSKVADGKVLELIERFLQQGVMEESKVWNPTQGVAQGSGLSPLLANLYLHDLDKLMVEKGYRYTRYADDFVVLCKTETEATEAMEIIRKWMRENGLELHPNKTRISNSRRKGQGFDFLGYRFEGKCRYVRNSSLRKLKDNIRMKTKRTAGTSIDKIILNLNPTLKGWFAYFKHAHKLTFKTIDSFIRRRLRAVLRKQEKRPGFGRCYDDQSKWPNAFFAAHGLFTLKEAHIAACQSRC